MGKLIIKARKTLRDGDVLGKKDLILIEPDGKERLIDPVHWIKYARKTAKVLVSIKKELLRAKRTIIK